MIMYLILFSLIQYDGILIPINTLLTLQVFAQPIGSITARLITGNNKSLVYSFTSFLYSVPISQSVEWRIAVFLNHMQVTISFLPILSLLFFSL